MSNEANKENLEQILFMIESANYDLSKRLVQFAFGEATHEYPDKYHYTEAVVQEDVEIIRDKKFVPRFFTIKETSELAIPHREILVTFVPSPEVYKNIAFRLRKGEEIAMLYHRTENLMDAVVIFVKNTDGENIPRKRDDYSDATLASQRSSRIYVSKSGKYWMEKGLKNWKNYLLSNATIA